jgi:hypothetical protein
MMAWLDFMQAYQLLLNIPVMGGIDEKPVGLFAYNTQHGRIHTIDAGNIQHTA